MPPHGFQRAHCAALGVGGWKAQWHEGMFRALGRRAQVARTWAPCGDGQEQRCETWQELLLVVSQGKLGNQVKLQLPTWMGLKAVCCGEARLCWAWARPPQGSVSYPVFPHSRHSCQLNDCIMFCGAGIPWIIKALPWCWKFRLFPIFCCLEFVAEIVYKCIYFCCSFNTSWSSSSPWV